MNSDHSKLRQQEHEEQSGQLQTGQSAQAGRTFESPEDMLRHDSEQNPVPDSVAQRLNESLAGEPKPAAAWWKKLFKT